MGSWREYKWEFGESINGNLGEYKWEVGVRISGKLESINGKFGRV